MLDALLDLFVDVVVSNGELHPRISHLQGGMDAFHWRKAWLCPRKKQQRRSVRCCNAEALKRSAMYRARSCASVCFSCGRVGSYSVKLQGVADRVSTYRHLVTHDVIDWLELCMCPFTVMFKYSQTKYSRMAAEPQKNANIKPRKN